MVYNFSSSFNVFRWRGNEHINTVKWFSHAITEQSGINRDFCCGERAKEAQAHYLYRYIWNLCRMSYKCSASAAAAISASTCTELSLCARGWQCRSQQQPRRADDSSRKWDALSHARRRRRLCECAQGYRVSAAAAAQREGYTLPREGESWAKGSRMRALSLSRAAHTSLAVSPGRI